MSQSAPQPCASGCTVRGQHVTTCETKDAKEACRGCLPRSAEHGRLCRWCWQRLTADVATAPGLVHHLREIGRPMAQTNPASDGKAYRDPAESTVRPAAWDAADEVHALLASYAHLVLEEHRDGAHMKGPDETGAVRSTTTLAAYEGETYLRRTSVSGIRDPQPEPREWAEVVCTATERDGTPIEDREGKPIEYLQRVPLPAPGAPDPAVPTQRLVAWLMPLLPWCAEQEWAAVMRQEVASVIATTSARWPTAAMVERERRVAMPCPRCELMSLVYAPPSFETQPFKVSCSNPDCARVWSEDEWANFVYTVERHEARHPRAVVPAPEGDERDQVHEHEWERRGDEVRCADQECGEAMPVTWETKAERRSA